jgi:clan AA aspartic protease (TIGR02281 family)
MGWFQIRRDPLPYRAIIAVGMGLAWGFTFTGPAGSALFSCIESPGLTIITDSPAQLSQCRPLSESTSPTRDERPHRSAPTSDTLATTPPPVKPPQLASPPEEHSVRPTSIFVPLERIGSLFVVTIQLNETRPARLILDTGASHTILSHAIARDLGLYSRRPVASVTMHTAGGSVQADMVQVDSIRIAGAEVRDSLAAIHDLPDAPPDIEGLLGLSVLRQFEVTLDTARSRLHLGLLQP